MIWPRGQFVILGLFVEIVLIHSFFLAIYLRKMANLWKCGARALGILLKVWAEYELLIRLPLGLLRIARAAFGFTQRADGGVPMNLLVAG